MKTRVGSAAAAAMFVLSFANCPEPVSDDPARDAGLAADAGTSVDAGPFDAGAEADAGLPVDAGAEADAGLPVDAGVEADAGQPVDAGGEADAGAETDAGRGDAGAVDAGVADAGTVMDAGAAMDAGVLDAGAPLDAGVLDAGAPTDAGVVDAGGPTDAGVDPYAGCGTADADDDGIPDLCDPCPGSDAVGDGLTRTPWQMHEGGLEVGAAAAFPHKVPAPCTTSTHGAECLYGAAAVPTADDAAWTSAPDGDIIALARSSTVQCFQEVDYTYFQSFVSVPVSTSVSQFTIDLAGMDDGSRVSIYNSTYPDGHVVPGSYVMIGETGTADLAPLLVPGVNRVIITQMDDCASHNNLASAVVTLNGSSVGVGECDCLDLDEDGTCDDDDRCPGADDAADADGDGIPDGCDACPNIADVGAGLIRTPWQMHQGGLEAGATGPFHITAAPCATTTHGATCLYDAAVIPSAEDMAWGPAPNPETIGFARGSSIPCFTQVDYTYFQTFVNVPPATTLTSFTVDFSGMDDGARITVFNSTYPAGHVIADSYVLSGGTGTTDLAALLVPGVNRVVVTQVDDCAVGNNLQRAATSVNGGEVDVGDCR